MQALPFVALALVTVVLGVGALWLAPRLAPKARARLAAWTLVAAPMAWLAVLAFADQLLGWTAPVSGLTFASYVGLAIGLLAATQAVAVLLPERHVWSAAAAAPLAAAILAMFSPSTTAGGVLSLLLALVLMAAAAVLPRAAALASVDRSRAFVGIVAALTLVMGAGFGAFLGAAAVREGGLGLAEATRDFRLEVDPSFDGTYRLVAPFPAADAPGARAVAAEWQGHARVVEGDGVVAFVESGDALVLVARGPVVVEARYLFHAPEEVRANLTAYVVPDVPLLLDAPPNGSASVAWRASATLDGAPCAERETRATLTAGAPQPLAALEERALWPSPRCGAR